MTVHDMYKNIVQTCNMIVKTKNECIYIMIVVEQYVNLSERVKIFSKGHN